MSGAELSRRTILAASTVALCAHAAKALELTNPVQTFVGLAVPDGNYAGEAIAAGGGLSVHAFRGIRYARAKRFEAPEPTMRAEQNNGNRFGPACPQTSKRYAPFSEDCLFLNVWSPATRSKKPRAVMVYFHGGAYSTGSVADPFNDGMKLAGKNDVVVVTVNHRLNALGYLYMPDRFPDSGNAGQLDLILALNWVQRNIAAFGGDPKNVTVFGQSGGGAKIATLMAMPAAKGLFHKAITMSGQQVTASGPMNAAKRTKAFLEKLGEGVDPATVPADKLIEALSATDPVLGGVVYMGPVLDMRNLLRHPFWPDAAPQSLHIPMMLGNTINETRAFLPESGPKLNDLNWSNLAERMSLELRVDIKPEWVVAEFRKRYPDYTPEDVFYAATTAGRSWPGQVIEADERAKAGAPTFVYQLDFERAKHADDIGLSFGTIPNPTPAQQAMSDTVMAAFVRFAKTGNPGWPKYDLKTRNTMVFDTKSRVVSDPRKWERELFARVPYIQPGS